MSKSADGSRPLAPAGLVIVIERIDAGVRHVGTLRRIAVNVEQRVRIAAVLPADRFEVHARVDPGRRDACLYRNAHAR